MMGHEDPACSPTTVHFVVATMNNASAILATFISEFWDGSKNSTYTDPDHSFQK